MYKIIRADERHRKDINKLTREYIHSELDRDEKIKNLWIVRGNDGQVIACCGLDFYNKIAIFTSLVVEKKFRHQGIGSALINHRLEIARQRGMDTIAFVTMYYHFNFYKRRGFQTCPRVLLPEELKNYWMFTAQRYKKCAVMYKRIA